MTDKTVTAASDDELIGELKRRGVLIEVEFSVHGDFYDAAEPPNTNVLSLDKLVPLFRVRGGKP